MAQGNLSSHCTKLPLHGNCSTAGKAERSQFSLQPDALQRDVVTVKLCPQYLLPMWLSGLLLFLFMCLFSYCLNSWVFFFNVHMCCCSPTDSNTQSIPTRFVRLLMASARIQSAKTSISHTYHATKNH